jgi:DNA gyrase subunit A
MSLRFHEEQLRDQGRNTVGVWGIRPEKKDHVVGIALVDLSAMLLVAGENGIGKRTPFDDYRKQNRGGKGIITMKTGTKTGDVVGALTVRDSDEIMLITTKGQMVRTRVKEIRETGRNTMGVKLMDLRSGEKLQAIAPVVSQAAEEEAQSAEPTEAAAPAKPEKPAPPKKKSERKRARGRVPFPSIA